MNAISEMVGLRLRVERKAAKLTLAVLADKAGMSSRFVGEIERGRANPSLGSLADLASALQIPLLALLLPECGPAKREWLERLPDLSEQDAQRALDATAGKRHRPLALIGLRGAGKSTVGRYIALKTDRPFVEINQQIESEAGMGLASIFELHGEAHYRELELGVLTAVLRQPGPPPVIEISGGVVTHEATWRLLLREAHTLWLEASPQEHWDRVVAQGDQRPMGGRERARLELEELYQRRRPRYAEAETTVSTHARPSDEVGDEILALLKN